ncbi:hypothetical protein PPYR_03738 [Photinus pyralis]|uniref:Integrase catalytic domain-containing protein n=1 Tax=Photinus pyralis TaxID=7054 RepID=A0A5N4A3S3_PHOPY|nr:hypothetical protein PPYR_03738 [Photinus pyralis]
MDSNEKLRPMKLSGNLAENWKSWIQRFEIYSTATELDGKDQKIQCAQMLHHMGEDAINIFNSFTFADNEKNKIASLKEKFANYFVPKTNVTYERYKFFTSRQNEEPLEQFITNLKNQAQLCNLGEEALRNELIKTICGKNHSINNCSAYGALCNNCKKPNHFANVCKYKSHRNRKINEIVDHDNYEQSLLINEISNNSKINNCTIELIVNNKVNVFVNFKVDTGANANIISLDQLKSIEFNEKSIQRSHEILLTFTGKCYLHLRLKDKLIKNVEFHIHKGNGSIIGINACVELDIIKFHEEIHLIYKPGKDLIIADTLSRANSSKTFDDNLDLEAQVCLIQKKLIITDNRVAQLVKEVSKDEELQSIKKYVVNGWPSISKIPSNINPYHKLKAEITLVDYYSKFPEISNLQKNLTSSNIINKLKAIFARHGIPKIVVSDSAKQFTGIEFQNFSKQWNFLSIKSSPHHQQSNGQTERTIQTIKKLIKKSTENNEDIYLALLAFRNTPVYNSYTPSQILMSRYLRDNLLIIDSKLNPKLINNTKLNQKISNSQSYNKKQYDSKGVRPRQDFKIGTAVWYQLKPKSLWEKGKIVDKLSNTTYKVQTLDDSHQNVISNKDSDHSKPSVSASDERSKRQIRLPPALNDYVLYK